MKVSIDLDNAADAAEVKRARAMLDALALDAEERTRLEEREKQIRGLPEARRALLRSPLVDLGLTARTRNALIAAGVCKIGDLVMHSAAKLRKYQNIGNGSVSEIREALATIDLDLAPNERGRPMNAMKEE